MEGQDSTGNWGYGKVSLSDIVIDRDNEKQDNRRSLWSRKVVRMIALAK